MSIATEISSLEAQLKAQHLYDVEGAEVRSRIHWLEEGEKPTRFFFQLEKERAAKHVINSVFNSQVVEVSSRPAIEQAHVDFYTQLFAAEPVDLFSQRQLFSNLTVKLSNLEHDSCKGSISLPEISAAAQSLSLNKSPGPDGFTLEFYLHFWDLFGPLLVNVYVYKDSFSKGSLCASM